MIDFELITCYDFDERSRVWKHSDRIGRDCWVSPDGQVFNCRAHEIAAEKILQYIYHYEDDDNLGGDMLIRDGWVKFTTSCMGHYYRDDGMYEHLTDIQKAIYDNCFNF